LYDAPLPGRATISWSSGGAIEPVEPTDRASASRGRDLVEARWNRPVVVSYAQNAEDIRLLRLFEGQRTGFYVDVGAGDPVVDSVTKLFYDAGWSGINIEPGPSYTALAAARPRDINLDVAVGERHGRRELWVTRPDTALSSFTEPDLASLPRELSVEKIFVDVTTLDDVLSAHASGKRIDFLKIDAEGAEREVLASFDRKATRPRVVIVEAIAPLSNRPTHDEWESLLVDADYVFAAFDGINRFYVPVEHEDLVPALAYPISPLDRYESSRIAFLQALVKDMTRTFSWRLTRPLRRLRRMQRIVSR
jgi:FkbM family methyltransferase